MDDVEIALYKAIWIICDELVNLIESALHNILIAIDDYIFVDACLSDSINIPKSLCCTFHDQV